jgi:hypothetical protein
VSHVLSAGFLAAVSLAAAVGFLLYGGRLFLMLQRFPIESRGRKKKLREVGMVTSICAACFTIRWGGGGVEGGRGRGAQRRRISVEAPLIPQERRSRGSRPWSPSSRRPHTAPHARPAAAAAAPRPTPPTPPGLSWSRCLPSTSATWTSTW